MARRQRHLVEIGGVPRRRARGAASQDCGGFRSAGLSADRACARQRPPLTAIACRTRSKLAVCVRPFVPDGDAVFLEITNVRIARDEPQKLMHDGFQMQLLRRDERKPCDRSKRIWCPNTEACGARPVGLLHPSSRMRWRRSWYWRMGRRVRLRFGSTIIARPDRRTHPAPVLFCLKALTWRFAKTV